jgi:MFS transporter, ACS family, tartrate transporter
MLVTGPWSFFGVRFLLGVAEAGFFPGIVLYLTFWFTDRERARMMALFMTAIAFSGVVGNPLSGAIMKWLDGVGGLSDWQWLFLLEGIPSVLLGIVVLFYLPDGPELANWLAPAERTWFTERLKSEDHGQHQRHIADLLPALLNGRVWLLIGVYFTVAVGANAFGAYLPGLLKDRFKGSNQFEIGLLAALPNICAVVGMTLLSRHSDRVGERRKHVAGAAFFASAGWALVAVTSSPWLALAGLCIAQTGMMSMLPTFWPMPASFLRGVAAAGGIALINSVGNLGGVLGPSILGEFGIAAIASTLFAGGILVLFTRQEAIAY